MYTFMYMCNVCVIHCVCVHVRACMYVQYVCTHVCMYAFVLFFACIRRYVCEWVLLPLCNAVCLDRATTTTRMSSLTVRLWTSSTASSRPVSSQDARLLK